MSRYVVRALPLIAALLAFTNFANADAFTITFNQLNTGNVLGTGAFTTDGVCATCSVANGGLLSFIAEIGPDTGAAAFTGLTALSYNRSANNFSSPGGTNPVTGDFLVFPGGTSFILETEINGVDQNLAGNYTIVPAATVPEPATLAFLLPSAAIALSVRRRRRLPLL